MSFRGSICMLRVRLITDALVLVQLPSAEAGEFSPGTSVDVSVRSVPVLAVAKGRGYSGAASRGEPDQPKPTDVAESASAS